jgi:HAD superfamily hydrolase (TIGR01509 family)
MTRFELVIFDCDGVLVDSERLAVRTEAVVLAELGWPLSEAEIVERFVGRSAAYMHGEVERAIGRTVDWEHEVAPRYRSVFDEELTAVDGVAGVLQALRSASVPVCVASSSTHEAIGFKLRCTGLSSHFEQRVFSTEDVERAKPAPDVFLHAAASMGITPMACAVVEDSPAGIESGLSAGMAVFAYRSGLVPPERLAMPGVTVFDAMVELPALLGVAGAAVG